MDASSCDEKKKHISRRRKFQAKPIVAGQPTASVAPPKRVELPKSPQAPTGPSAPDESSLLSTPFSPVPMTSTDGRWESVVGSPLGLADIKRSRLLSSTESLAGVVRQKRVRIMSRDEKLDSKKHTLADLVQWKPPGEDSLQKKWSERRDQLLESMSEKGGPDSEDLHQSSSMSIAGDIDVPRVRMNDEGEMVLEAVSLPMTSTTGKLEDVWETVDDTGRVPKMLNSMSFRKYKRPSNWTQLETDLFFEVMAATGTDFALMHDYIPIRSRAELKKKFVREQKESPDRVNEVLRNPCMLDETVQERADQLLEKIEEEQKKLLQRRRPKKLKSEEEEEDEDEGGDHVDEDECGD